METLQLENESNQLRIDSLSTEVNQLQSVMEERELLIQQCKENEKNWTSKPQRQLMKSGGNRMRRSKKSSMLKRKRYSQNEGRERARSCLRSHIGDHLGLHPKLRPQKYW
ncbi:unnamed protein product [Arabis nemorensis]|uniref:Uncharacterized protein n=1 Tax=Arabis nemorensis TaxID=586526 RepID=A0A565B253_9BRAS|nr:unnamed protein product [Arabis nemorensis]